ncbi:MAG TPA: hypothetical protein VMV71_00270 [Candidatus Paceibacterota bacterium]|nr:hypothetical protein [Candidatus Paceibacterota bacterium]
MDTQKENMKSPWEEDEGLENSGRDEHKSSAMATAAKIATPILIIAIAGYGLYYFLTRPTGVNVAVEFSKPDQILSGQPFALKISLSNNSDQVLKNSHLSVSLPDNVYYLNGPQSQRVIETDVGDIGPGSATINTFNIVIIGDTNSLKHIDAKLSYQLAGSTAQFESNSGIDLPVNDQAVDVSFELPQSVFSGSNFDLKVDYKNNSGQDFGNDVILNIDYPAEFHFSKSSIDPSSGNNQWDLGKLPKGASSSITITGSISDSGKSSYDFNGSVSASGPDYGGQNFTIAEQTAGISISASPLSISATINGKDNNASDYVARAGDELVYDLHYKNNSSVTFENVTVKASLLSSMVDFQTLKTDASFSSIGNTFTWLAANEPALATLAPGEEGDLSIDVKLKKDFPIRLISDKNYTLRLNTEISSPTVPQGVNAQQTVSDSSFETKIAGNLQIQAKGLWRDAASGFVNSGPYPPRVNQPTQYTVHWILANYATDVSNVQVSAYLQSGAQWTGNVKSNIDSQPSYDPTSGKVTWDVGSVMANKGVISQPIEAVFQVEVTPAINQIGQYITFLSGTSVQWQDDFVNAQLTGSYPTLTTMLVDDPTISAAVNRTVQQ